MQEVNTNFLRRKYAFEISSDNGEKIKLADLFSKNVWASLVGETTES
jgi:hypothetical protein